MRGRKQPRVCAWPRVTPASLRVSFVPIVPHNEIRSQLQTSNNNSPSLHPYRLESTFHLYQSVQSKTFEIIIW